MSTASKTMLTKVDIKEVDDRSIEELQVPEWDGWVCVRALSGTERDVFESGSINIGEDGKVKMGDGMFNMRARLCAMCICDDTGHRIFTDDDVIDLGRKNANALNRVFKVAQRLSGISADDVKDLEKNSDGATGNDSSSGSPGTSE